MGSPPMFGGTPPPGPDIANQMGGAPSGLAGIAQQQMAARPAGALPGQGGGQVNPHGLLLSKADAIKSVLDTMARDEPTFAPYARQAINKIVEGVTAVMSAPQAGMQGLPAEMGGNPPEVPPLA